jgi:hypothetical protein
VQHDDLVVDGAQCRVVQPPLAQGRRPGVGDHHVGVFDQPTQQGLAFGDAQVQGDRTLVAPQRLPHQPDAVDLVAPGADRVTAVGLLDLDDVGAELAQIGGGQRRGGQRGDVENPDAVKHHAPTGTQAGRCNPR